MRDASRDTGLLGPGPSLGLRSQHLPADGTSVLSLPRAHPAGPGPVSTTLPCLPLGVLLSHLWKSITSFRLHSSSLPPSLPSFLPPSLPSPLPFPLPPSLPPLLPALQPLSPPMLTPYNTHLVTHSLLPTCMWPKTTPSRSPYFPCRGLSSKVCKVGPALATDCLTSILH